MQVLVGAYVSPLLTSTLHMQSCRCKFVRMQMYVRTCVCMYVRMHKCTHAGYSAHGHYQFLRSCDFAQKLKVKETPPVPKTTDLRNNAVRWAMATNTMSLT